mmetsp:Transcript_15058/g.24505  ORF Transcript_15058/g.24505 Transcript_15058/m.24505 type:complete len:409 (+) Transcript_15058:101-1327(+)
MSLSAVVDVRTPSAGLLEWNSRGWVKAEVRYHGFAGLSPVIGRGLIKSPEFTCVGCQWCLLVLLSVHPTSDDGMVGVFLHNMSAKDIKIVYGFCVKDSDGKEVNHRLLRPHTFSRKGTPGNKDIGGVVKVAKRSTMIDSLVDGTLIIEVRMKLAKPTETPPTAFVPENPFCNIIQQMFMDEETADVVFEVGERQTNSNGGENAKTSPATFYAHQLILQKGSSTLAELCGSVGEETTQVSITDVTPDIFHHLLHYVYGGKVAEDDLKANSKDLIDAADKYGISNLKLEAEACFVNSTTITTSNMMEHLLYADAKNCALMKESVMDFIVENTAEVLEKVSLKDLPGGPTMFADILAAMARGEKENESEQSSGNDQLSTMRISDLRRKVHEKGLDIDGSRETLIATLKEHS